ncbi:hypothetical protein BC835DRAFT_1281486 [Cytidiella melzeri]|nr:hypothetical protein BC835DRAFT_1281486 [Cytidiella melzeri]
MKMHHYLRSWKFDTRKGSAFLTNTIRQMIKYTYTSMRNNALNKVAKASGGRCETQKAVVLWLGAHAFHTALCCKSQAYQAVLRSLEFDLSLPQYRRVRKRMRKVVREGQEVIRMLSF